jgi:hypothetical protein
MLLQQPSPNLIRSPAGEAAAARFFLQKEKKQAPIKSTIELKERTNDDEETIHPTLLLLILIRLVEVNGGAWSGYTIHTTNV